MLLVSQPHACYLARAALSFFFFCSLSPGQLYICINKTPRSSHGSRQRGEDGQSLAREIQKIKYKLALDPSGADEFQKEFKAADSKL